MTYQEWAMRNPRAAAELQQVIGAAEQPPETDRSQGKSEAWAQQQVRFKISKAGAAAWRNNVGAMPAKTQHRCPRCGFAFEEKQQPVRYGLANDSPQLNARVKSSDLILAIPRLIQPHHVGTVIAQFGSVEVKRPGWQFDQKNPHEAAQAAWLALIKKLGGFTAFSTGELEL